MESPKNPKEVQRLMGFAVYLFQYIPNFLIITKPIYRLLRKGQPFVWGLEQSKAVNQLKQTLASEPVCGIYDHNKKCVLHTDASAVGFAGILFKKGHPIGYFSQRLLKSESNYLATELELLAVITSFDRFRIYLKRTHFKLVTDHSAIKWLIGFSIKKRRLYKWANKLSVYTFDIEQKFGRLMQHIDALSRSLVCMATSALPISNQKSNLSLD